MRNISTIWLKELRDTIRDRRTLMSMIIMPMLLMPLLIVGLGKLIQYQTQQSERQVLKVAFNQSAVTAAPALVDYVTQQPKIEIVQPSQALTEAVASGAVDAAIVVPDTFSQDISQL